jgi:hypothetical protein
MKATPADPVVRFETAPGEQMQADFTVVRRGREPLLAFVATLGYSRASWVRFTIARGHRRRWSRGCAGRSAEFGGVPAARAAGQRRGPWCSSATRTAPASAPLEQGGCWRWLAGARVQAAAVPTVPGEDQGQGRAVQRVPQGQLPGAAGGDAARARA